MYTAIPAKNLQESIEFYGKTLGLTIVDENPNGTWFQSGMSRFAVFESEYAGTNKATCAIIEVIDPEGTVTSLKERGVKFEEFDMPGAKRQGDIYTLANFKAAWFKDPSGNIIAIGSHL